MAKKFLTGVDTTALKVGNEDVTGKVLTGDSSGNATWQDATGGSHALFVQANAPVDPNINDIWVKVA